MTSATLDIPRYSRGQFLAILQQRLYDQDYPATTVARTIPPLVAGYVPPTWKANRLLGMLNLTVAEMSEFRRHFYGGD